MSVSLSTIMNNKGNAARTAAIARRLRADEDESMPKGLGYWAARDARAYTGIAAPSRARSIG